MRSSMQIQTRLWRIFFCLIGLSCPFQAIKAKDGVTGRRLAIVIGVNAYRPTSGLGSLHHAVKDATRLSAILRKSGYTVIEMTHDAAREPGKEVLVPSLPNIRDQIGGVLETPNLGEHDSVLITFHGHGVNFSLSETVVRNGKSVEQKSSKFYFCPADASIRDVTSANDLTDRNALLPLDELYETLGECKAATKLLIVDACRNDPNQSQVFRDGGPKSLTMPKIPSPPRGLVAFLSCRESQRAVEDNTLGVNGHGVFTHFLIQGLEGKADLPLAEGTPADGIVTLSELITYTANNTYSYVLKKFPGVRQSPELKGEFDANLAIVILPVEDPDYVKGVALLMGKGTKINIPAAIRHFRDAANRDQPLALAQLAVIHQQGFYVKKDVNEASRLAIRSFDRIEKLARGGNSEAQFALGFFQRVGLGCHKDIQSSINWIRKSAEQNYATAQFALASIYRNGDGVSKDSVKTVQLLLKAAEQGHAMAQAALAAIYTQGDGVTKDYAQGGKWCRMAVAQNLAPAQLILARMYFEGEGVTKDPVEAVKWCRMATEQDFVPAQYQLAELYYYGKGVAEDKFEAIKWYRIAAEQNHASAQYSLAYMYSKGQGLERDSGAAVKWYRKAADQDHPEAQYELGGMYETGKGVAKNEDEAEKLYQKVLANSESDSDLKSKAEDAINRLGKTP